ncbi:MAG: hypothetical protein LBK13_11720 [Spirochaetales bacterium]|jgi:hypothetical protein|nr:hypothetical protein [Spirochaetales bacterium]
MLFFKPKALREVMRWKREISKKTNSMTNEERLEYFTEAGRRFEEKMALRKKQALAAAQENLPREPD